MSASIAASALLGRIRAELEGAFGGRLRSVLLHGSEARGTATKESDVDVLVVLEGPVMFWDDLGVITRAVYPLVLETGRLIHARPVDAARFDAGGFPLYDRARREGILA